MASSTQTLQRHQNVRGPRSPITDLVPVTYAFEANVCTEISANVFSVLIGWFLLPGNHLAEFTNYRLWLFIDEFPCKMASGIETPPASLQTEAQNLKQRLDAIRNQYVGWTKKDCATMIQTMEEQSASLTDTALHNEKVIRQEIVDCKALLSDNKKKMSHEAEKEIKLTEELSAVAEKSDILLQQKEQLETEVKRRREDNHQQRELVTEKEASTGDVKQGLEKSAKFFRESLGLQFKKVSGGRLQVIFTLLDPQYPNQPFVFCVKINENSYTVTDVDPSIPQLPEYISKLNETNDFQRFIRNMRAAFKATLKS